MRIAAIAAAALAGGCTMDLPREPRSASEPPTATGCDATLARSFVGGPASEAEAARVAAKAGTIRLIRPGDAVTMDYRADRLDVELDAAGAIKTLRCG